MAPEQLMPEWLAQRAYLSPGKLALICGLERWTFAHLDRRAALTATLLRAAGVQAGDRVAVLSGNSIECAQVIFGIIRAGAILVPLNLRLTPSELELQVLDCDAACLIVDEANRERVATFAVQHRVRVADFASVALAPDPDASFEAPVRTDLDAVQSIIYTSGTTGRPKGCMISYCNHFWSAVGSALNFGITDSDRWLAAMPLFHIGGLSILFKGVIYGMTVVIHPTFQADSVNRSIDEDRITSISVVTTMLRRMFEARGEMPYPATLRCVLLGGGPIPPDLVKECARRVVPVAQSYSLTESCSQAATLLPAEAATKPRSAGKPLFPTEVEVLRDDDSVADPLEPGEIVIRGPTVTPGYFHREADTARVLRNGWLHTGDFGYLDSDRYLYVLDRRNDIIVTGGENVYPAEVEGIIESHPAVREAGVFAIADPDWGQVVATAICLKSGAHLDEEALKAFFRVRRAGFKVPREIRFLDELPRNAAGKLLRRELGATAPAGANDLHSPPL